MTERRSLIAGLAAASLALSAPGCPWLREPPGRGPSFEGGIGGLLAERCAGCHGGDEPAASWAATSYLEALGCVEDGRPAVLPADGRAPILAALDREDHEGLLDEGERAVLEAWVLAGAPSSLGAMHDPRYLDPRSETFHGEELKADGYAAMLEPDGEGACGRCHEGVPSRPEGAVGGARGAPDCTTCHSGPGGVLGCGTCHGVGTRAYPPSDPCFHPDAASEPSTHAAHVEPGALSPGFGCGLCHPPSGGERPGTGAHGDGRVDLELDPELAGPAADYDPGSRTCSVACHDRGGEAPRPSWTGSLELDCDSCHQTPPPDHYRGMCTDCHPQLSADGSRLLSVELHVNGRVDLGDGTGSCGACHGSGWDFWPSSGAHAAHRDPAIASRVACGTCHPVPAAVEAPGHIDREPGADVVLTGLAAARGVSPAWDGEACSSVACHGAGLAGSPDRRPSWEETSGASGECGACHGLPPPPPHPTSATCEALACHGAEVARDGGVLRITEEGRTLHVNGVVDVGRAVP